MTKKKCFQRKLHLPTFLQKTYVYMEEREKNNRCFYSSVFKHENCLFFNLDFLLNILFIIENYNWILTFYYFWKRQGLLPKAFQLALLWATEELQQPVHNDLCRKHFQIGVSTYHSLQLFIMNFRFLFFFFMF